MQIHIGFAVCLQLVCYKFVQSLHKVYFEYVSDLGSCKSFVRILNFEANLFAIVYLKLHKQIETNSIQTCKTLKKQ